MSVLAQPVHDPVRQRSACSRLPHSCNCMADLLAQRCTGLCCALFCVSAHGCMPWPELLYISLALGCRD